MYEDKKFQCYSKNRDKELHHIFALRVVDHDMRFTWSNWNNHSYGYMKESTLV